MVTPDPAEAAVYDALFDVYLELAEAIAASSHRLAQLQSLDCG